jgi:DNA polymerase-1
MQGSAADIIKLAMIDVDGWLMESGIDAKMIMQVHDELVLEVREDLVPKVMAIVDEKMSSAAELDVPLVVESGMGDNWEVAH